MSFRLLCAASEYFYLNPVRARLLDAKRPDLIDCRWSSFPLYAARTDRPVCFKPGTAQGEMGFDGITAGRREYAERMRERVDEPTGGRLGCS